MKYDVRLSLTPIYPYIPAPAPDPLACPRRRENDRVVAGRVVTCNREYGYRRTEKPVRVGPLSPRRKELAGGASRSSFEYCNLLSSLCVFVWYCKTLFCCLGLRGRFHGLCASPMLSYVAVAPSGTAGAGPRICRFRFRYRVCVLIE
jgi:hypothetical protein